MEIASRIFFCLLLFFYSTASFGIPRNVPTIVYNSFELSPFEENGKFGLKNNNGEILIPPQYEQLGWSNGTFSIVENVTGYRLNGQWGVINLSNQKITKPDFIDLSPGQGSVLIARKKIGNSIRVLTGCISTGGKVVVPFSYDGLSVSSFRAIVYEKSGTQFKHGLIDFDNKVLIPLEYQSIYPLGSLRYAVVSFENKTAIFTEDGTQLTGFIIDSLAAFKKNFAVIYQNQKQGLINREGKIVLEPIYREIKIEEDGSVHTRKADTWIVLEGGNKQLLQINADSIKPLLVDLYKIKTGQSFQLANKELKPLNHLMLNSIGKFEKGKAVFTSGSKKGIIAKNGNVVIVPRYENLIPDGPWIRAEQLVGNLTRWSILDTTGQAIASKNYEYIAPFNGNFFPVKNRGFWGAVNTDGKEVIACVHDSLGQVHDQFVVVKFKGQYGVINTNEQWVVTPQKHPIKLIGYDRYLLLTKPVFLKSLKGEVIYFTENLFELKNDYLIEYLSNGNVLKIDMNGVIADRYFQTEGIDIIFPESEGFRAIKKDGRYGFIDDRSRLRVANRYEDVRAFHEGLAAAKILGKWGFISKQDKIVIQPVYDEVKDFKSGFAVVRQKELYGLVDATGKLVLPVRYEQVEVLPTQRFLIKQNAAVGLADAKGKIILNPKYDRIQDPGNNFIIVEREGKSGVVTTQGVSTIPLIYDGVFYDEYHDQYLALRKSAWEVATF